MNSHSPLVSVCLYLDFKIILDISSTFSSSGLSKSTDIDDYEINFLLFRLSGLHRRQLCKFSYISPLSKSFERTHYVWVLAFAPPWSLWQS
jgi:hypothetical protein